ncbi:MULTISPECIES: hypothetical protein [Pseudomonas]|uniref:hypothetical protein n=1 Tax=Pseudomonas TaxID=286 RepID=UPI001E35ED29|nr:MULTISPECIES: hypothetical protein [Pseudomonas]MCE0871060.1 hypothetical protein [Pseudomonas alloputida]MDH1550992.1 hypothetical protein [Pseudomonas juntendi]
MSRKNYTVIVGYPRGGGHYAKAGESYDLLDVEAHALVQAGRIKLTAEAQAEQAAPASKKSTAKAE